MRKYELKGIVVAKGKPTTQFTVVVDSNDQASARRLVQMQYGTGGTVTINKIVQLKN
jgi:hypothetical protein